MVFTTSALPAEHLLVDTHLVGDPAVDIFETVEVENLPLVGVLLAFEFEDVATSAGNLVPVHRQDAVARQEGGVTRETSRGPTDIE
jgi:hypothetical protein